MSLDAHLLQACARRCGAKIVYVDLVSLQFQEEVEDDALEDAGASPVSAAGPKFGIPKKAYFCVGQSCVYLLRSSMSHRLKAFNGQLDYVWMEKIVQDTSSRSRFLIALNEKRPKGAPSQFILDTDNRDALLSQIFTNYVSDCLQELGTLESLPCFQHSLATSPAPSRVGPPKGFKSVEFCGYTFFIRQSFKEVPSAISKVSTGHFSTPVGDLNLGERSWGWTWQQGNVELYVNVVDPIPLSELTHLGREHVRWVAMECKAPLLKSWDSLVLQNCPYTKKMNLANDLAAWSCWQLAVRDKEDSWAIIVLRRQYVAPMMDTVQDFVLALKCPSKSVTAEALQGRLLDEVAIIADSFSPSPHPNLNADIVQAKLDALLYDSEAYTWLHDRFKLQPHGPVDVEKHATIFVKGVVKSLYNEHILSSLDDLEEIEKRTSELCTLAETDLEPLTVALKLLSHPGQGLPRTAASSASIHAWQARVAHYLAHRLDGSILGSRVTLADLVQGVHDGGVSKETSAVFEDVLAFLLHLRPTNLHVPWELKGIRSQLTAMGLLSPKRVSEGKEALKANCTFNDKVMQALLETGHLRADLEDEDLGKGCMSMEYAALLANLLCCETASTNLKACVCRLIISDEAIGENGQSTVLANGLMLLVRTGASFLVTYACAALVNLCQSHEVVRSHLIHQDMVPLCKRNVRTYDDDLVLYSLMVLVQLTKRSNHRASVEKYGAALIFCLFPDSFGYIE
ncbi:unnamed protein product [Symbiodinium pilosum]|uniref:Uncharacterized protein n=1 Tax=Symbiodinium pilosum TaxID=2952 RepID=A0A812TBN5_SYMPI|nr:unnamed protein product [Symbiodinium pilosum]